MLISVRDMQKKKVSGPIIVTELGMLISRSDKQYLKAPSPIVFTELGIVIEVSGTSTKASPGISVTFSETITFLNKDKASVVLKQSALIILVSLLFD
jgi:hypothetical protein